MASPNDPSVDRAVLRIIHESALQGERAVSVARIVFCVATVVRSFWYYRHSELAHEAIRSRMTLGVVSLIVLFSLLVFHPWWRTRVALLVHVSAAVDAVGCFLALLPNPLWPWEGYIGLPNMPDLNAILVILFAAGLRHSPSAAVLSSVLNITSYLALVAVDRAVSGDRVPVFAWSYALYGIFVAGAASLAIIIAVRTRILAERSARTAVQATSATRSLSEILHGHHDLRSLLSAARLHADLVARGLAGSGARAGAAGTAAVADDLRDDLTAVSALVDDIKARAQGDLLALEGVQAVDAAAAIGQVVGLLRPRFPDVAMEAHCDGGPHVLVAGGEAGLRRMLLNLVTNACEGDGRRAATRVEVAVRATATGADHVRIEVSDDGPGVPSGLLDGAGGSSSPSSKAGGMGLGLTLVAAIARASSGTLQLGPRRGGGACAALELRRS